MSKVDLMADTEKAALERRIDELCAENERLRQENQSIRTTSYELGRASLEAENAELRKLAEDLHTLAYNALPERKTDYMTICSVEWCIDYYSKTMPEIENRMRKLGIEVPS